MPFCRPDAPVAYDAESNSRIFAVLALSLPCLKCVFLAMVGVSFHDRNERVSGLVDCGAGIAGTVFGPIHREHERVWHGGRANVVNVPRKARSSIAALESTLRAALFVNPGRTCAAVRVGLPTRFELAFQVGRAVVLPSIPPSCSFPLKTGPLSQPMLTQPENSSDFAG